MHNNCNTIYNKSRVEREIETQTQGYVSRFERQALCPRFHRVKDFYHLHKGTRQNKQPPTQVVGTKPTPLPKREAQSKGTKPERKKRYST